LSWKKVNHPSEVVSEGDRGWSLCIRLDKEKERIS
jgi:ribosomal protein S1